MGSGLDNRHWKSGSVKELVFISLEGAELDFKLCVFIKGKF